MKSSVALAFVIVIFLVGFGLLLWRDITHLPDLLECEDDKERCFKNCFVEKDPINPYVDELSDSCKELKYSCGIEYKECLAKIP